MRLAVSARASARKPKPESARAAAGVQWLVLACYLLGAVAVTWRLWADPASRAQAGDLRDLDQMTWFVRYSATAISHGSLPALVTTAMNPPHGVNLMWNTSVLLPGVLLSPVTLAAGPQVALTVLLTAGFAGSAASLFLVLRRWGASISAAAIGGAVYGFSPALLNAGIGHYHLQVAILPPLIISALLRIVTGRGSGVRAGIWLGLLSVAQLFTGEELLIETAIAGALLVMVLAVSRPRAALSRARAAVPGLAIGAGVALATGGYGLWVQFHGAASHVTAQATTVIGYHGHLTHLFALPYSFVTAPSTVLLHTRASAAAAAAYPQPRAEYLAYVGWPLIIVLVAATIAFWRHLAVRVPAVTLVVLELLALGSQALTLHGFRYPAQLLPGYWAAGLPVLSSALPDRLCILSDGAAGAIVAFSLDLARPLAARATRWRRGGAVATAVAVLAVLPLIPRPYRAAGISHPPAGWQEALTRLRLPADAPVLVVPVPWGGDSRPMRWQADTGRPGSMVGGDFIDPYARGRRSRAGRAGQTPVTRYLNALYEGSKGVPAPSRAQVRTDLATWKPAAVVAVTSRRSRLGRYLRRLFGPPAFQIRRVLAWRL